MNCALFAGELTLLPYQFLADSKLLLLVPFYGHYTVPVSAGIPT